MSNQLISERRSGGVSPLSTALVWSVPTTILVVLAVYFVDRPIALFIQENLYNNRTWRHLTRDLPDILLIMVVAISFTCYLVYLVRKRRQVQDSMTFLVHNIACSLPASFFAKSLFKLLFGRVQTRFWLQNPQQYAFHWFHGGDNFMGFPSGHMAVFATLFAAIWRVYPHYKPILVLLLGVLAILLTATNYHFLSDIIAGAYLGVLVEAVVARFLRKDLPVAH